MSNAAQPGPGLEVGLGHLEYRDAATTAASSNGQKQYAPIMLLFVSGDWSALSPATQQAADALVMELPPTEVSPAGIRIAASPQSFTLDLPQQMPVILLVPGTGSKPFVPIPCIEQQGLQGPHQDGSVLSR